jgi:hypothetical protein
MTEQQQVEVKKMSLNEILKSDESTIEKMIVYTTSIDRKILDI